MSKALRMLIIEDSEDDTLLLVREVKRGGYEVVYERVDTPLAMETALKQKTWDIVISDYSMPKFSAPGALALLGEQRLDLPFIIVSGKIGEDTAVAAMKDGANDYIMKDNLARLIPVIKRELHDAESRREHRRAKEVIAEQAEMLELFFRHTLDSVVLLDRNFNFIRVNEAYARVCRRDVSEFPGCNHFELYPSDAIKIFEDVVRTKKPFQTKSRPFVFPDHPERRVTYWDWTLVPVLDQAGEVNLLVFTLKDVTEHKLAEDALKDSESKFSAIFNNAIDGILLADIKYNKFVAGNESLCKMLGYSPEEIITLSVPDIHPEKDLPYIMEQFEKMARGEMVTAASIPVKRKDGSVFYADINASLMMLAGKQYLLGIFRDITEKKKLEAQLLHSQKIEAIGQLAGGVAHDFNNILTAIIGFSSIMSRKVPEDDPTRFYVEQIQLAAESAANLTGSLLTFGRKREINPMPLNFNTLIKKNEKLLSSIVREDIDFKTVLSDDNLTVMVDFSQMQQVLMNLVSNAQDAMPDGGNLTIETELVGLDSNFIKTHGFGKPGLYSLLSVSDTGGGMDEKIRQKIFEPFFTTKDEGEGTGLGLSIVYGIVKQHDGFITVYSEPGEGTTFRIYFKTTDVDMERKKEPIAEDLSGNDETILVAEDESAVRDSIKKTLEEFGYRVIEAVDGEDAVGKFIENKDKIQLLLFDVIMPKMSGKKAYEEIIKHNSSIKTIFTSGYTADIMHKKDLRGDNINYIAKPVIPDKLLKKIKEVINNKEDRVKIEGIATKYGLTE